MIGPVLFCWSIELNSRKFRTGARARAAAYDHDNRHCPSTYPQLVPFGGVLTFPLVFNYKSTKVRSSIGASLTPLR